MAEYSSDEERFSAFIDFFKDHKNTLLIGFLLLASVLISSISYKSYNTSQNTKAAEIYDAWFLNLSNESATASDDKENFIKLIQRMDYKTYEKNKELYFKYFPNKNKSKKFSKNDQLNDNPFKVLKNINFN